MKDTIIKITVGIIIGILFILSILTCRRNETKTTTTRKIGKTVLSSSKETVTFDTLKWIATYKANTKPVIKWVKPKAIHDTIEAKPLYSPCDSIFASQDSGSIQGVKYAIVDTTADNRVIGRSIKLQVPQTQITKQVLKVNDSLRVDTVYVTAKEKKKRFSVNIGTGFGFSPISPIPEPQIGIHVGFKLKSF